MRLHRNLWRLYIQDTDYMQVFTGTVAVIAIQRSCSAEAEEDLCKWHASYVSLFPRTSGDSGISGVGI